MNEPALPSDLQTVYVWKPEKIGSFNSADYIIHKIREKLDECNDDYDKNWTNITLKTVLSYEQANQGKKQAALKEIEECLHLMRQPRNDFLLKHAEGIKHTLIGSKLCIRKLMGHIVQRDELRPFNELNDVNKAAVYGLKAAVFLEYGESGWNTAAYCAQMARDLENMEPEWYYLSGKVLCRMRRHKDLSEIPSEEELSYFEGAMKLTTNNRPAYKVLLAQSYMEYARTTHYHKTFADINYNKTRSEMCKKAKQIYEDLRQAAGNCPNTYARCAQGYSKMPVPFRDIEKAKFCIRKALELSPRNPFVNHVAGKLREYIGNFELARNHYEIAKDHFELARNHYEIAKDQKVFGATLDFINLELKLNDTYDPTADIKEAITWFLAVQRQVQLRCFLGIYCCLCDRQMDAIKEWMKAVLLSSRFPPLEALKIMYRGTFLKLNIIQLLANEVQLAKDNANHEELEYLTKTSDFLRIKYPQEIARIEEEIPRISAKEKIEEQMWIRKNYSTSSYMHVHQKQDNRRQKRGNLTSSKSLRKRRRYF